MVGSQNLVFCKHTKHSASTQIFKRFYDAQKSVLVVSYLCYETKQ